MRGLRLHVLIAAAGMLCALACGPSAAEIKRARSTEYPSSAAIEVFEAAKSAMLEAGYELEVENPSRGLLVSTRAWYSKEGKRLNRGTRDGDAIFYIAVEIAPSRRGLVVHVDGGAQGYTAGSPVAQRFAHGDPREPTWVEGKINALELAIYNKLGFHALPPPAK